MMTSEALLGWQQCMGLIKTTVAEAAEDRGHVGSIRDRRMRISSSGCLKSRLQ